MKCSTPAPAAGWGRNLAAAQENFVHLQSLSLLTGAPPASNRLRPKVGNRYETEVHSLDLQT